VRRTPEASGTGARRFPGRAPGTVSSPQRDPLAGSQTTFEIALGAIDQAAPTQEQVDAAKAAAGDVKTNFAKVRTELGCPAS
jgi:hypothetical protein